jgi:hypothetical protein
MLFFEKKDKGNLPKYYFFSLKFVKRVAVCTEFASV